ncbi:hypothetical protein Rcae01_02548 [Novipirellula caenicola]|uniref:Uncharacterized protein n=1 Tax=Novipirellula caenicola TaxID=1536901 RepID=A0ABP9VS84_9BACT
MRPLPNAFYFGPFTLGSVRGERARRDAAVKTFDFNRTARAAPLEKLLGWGELGWHQGTASEPPWNFACYFLRQTCGPAGKRTPDSKRSADHI